MSIAGRSSRLPAGEPVPVPARPFPAQGGSMAAEGDRTPFADVDAYIEEQMARLQMPGVALAIVEGDQIVHLRGFGRARPGGDAPCAQTPFALGSLTKSFTALAVMQLVEQGKIELDAPVQRYLPWFRVAEPHASAQMTVRHLLNQTSGLPQLPGLLALADFDESPGATERQARALSTVKITRPVGSAFEYSNLNYNLLGLIVEVAGGVPYADWVREQIFAPLGMKHSFTTQAEGKQNGLAVGHQYWFAVPVAAPNLPMPSGSLPSGQLISSAEDMAHYLSAFLNGGRCGDAQVLSSDGMAELLRGVAEYRTMGIEVGKYAMGWFVTETGQTTTIWHSGTLPDFSSYMALLPAQKRGVILLFNADHHMMMPVLVGVGIGVTDLLAGRPPAPNRFGFMPWVMRAPLLIPFLQLLGVVLTLRHLRRWRHDPQQRPGRGRSWGLHLLLPLFPNLALAALPVYLRVSGFYRYMRLFMPDFLWLSLLCGGFAGLWSLLRTGLILRSLQTSALPISVHGKHPARR